MLDQVHDRHDDRRLRQLDAQLLHDRPEVLQELEGVTSFTVDGDTRDIRPGEAICIRRGQVHQFVNQGPAEAKFLSVATPGVFGPDYFRQIRDVLTAGGPPDVGALLEVMRRHGLTPA